MTLWHTPSSSLKLLALNTKGSRGGVSSKPHQWSQLQITTDSISGLDIGLWVQKIMIPSVVCNKVQKQNCKCSGLQYVGKGLVLLCSSREKSRTNFCKKDIRPFLKKFHFLQILSFFVSNDAFNEKLESSIHGSILGFTSIFVNRLKHLCSALGFQKKAV